MVEGAGRICDDRIRHAVWVLQYLFSTNPQDVKTAITQESITNFVAFRPVASVVRFTINFNDQS